MKWLRDWLICLAKRTPYRKGHIYHADGTLYMERYALFETKWLSARVHYIATEDRDEAMHDHPWSFISYVLRGAYVERRPMEVEPEFICNEEPYFSKARLAGSLAYRRATDRHLISLVISDTWTLFIYGPIVQWWGFYTPKGKIYWKDYIALQGHERILK